MSDLLGAEYQKMYDGYYTEKSSVKRQIGAQDSVRQMLTVLGADRFDKIVDVGAGEGSVLAILNELEICSQLFALEISSSGLAAISARNLRKLIAVKSFDGYKIPYVDKSFDLAIFTHVLEHVEHERLVLREIGRVAKRVLIVVPLEGHLRVANSIAVSGPFGHINYSRPETVRNLLETVNFRVIRANIDCYSLDYERLIAGRIKGMIKYATRKALLGVSVGLATSLFTYIGAFYCETE